MTQERWPRPRGWWALNATWSSLDFILRALGSHGEILNRAQAGPDLNIRNILLRA